MSYQKTPSFWKKLIAEVSYSAIFALLAESIFPRIIEFGLCKGLEYYKKN